MDPANEGIKFADFDITLTDRDLDDFLSFMEHQTNGVYAAEAMPQLPDVAMDFPAALQLQPHSGSPSHSHSEGSESAGVGTTSGAPPNGASPSGPSGSRQALAASDGSLTSVTTVPASPTDDPAAAAGVHGGSSSSQQQQRQQRQQRQAASLTSSPMDISSSQQQQQQQQHLQQQSIDIKTDPEMTLLTSFPISNSLPGVLAGSASSAAAGSGTTLAGTLAPMEGTLLMASCPPGTLEAPSQGFCLQPMQWQSSTAVATSAVPGSSQQQQAAQGLPQAMSQLMFVQGASLQQQQQQQQSSQLQQQQQQQQAQQAVALLQQPPAMNQQLAAFAGLAAGSSSHMDRQQSSTAGGRSNNNNRQQLQQLQQLQQQHRVTSYSDASGSKLQVSHSTVEKQRRDRLNSLIDELSDMVPPADPKYGSDTNSVRRPKHVVLADTINLLKAMQTKLQIEEAEISTLKQQAAAVGAIAAQHQVGHAAVPEAADAMMHAAAAAAAAGASPDQCLDAGASAAAAVYGGEACVVPVELPTAPESGANSTGVLVEQGIGCLYVKVNCKDRKGLLSDVVMALKGLPIVISTAAITTTKDGKVHDVFEVRMEDASVTAEDIQCAVQQALFSAGARSKRLRREDSNATMHVH